MLDKFSTLIAVSVATLMLLFSANLYGDNITEVFGEGIFELTWGVKLSDVQVTFPNGKKKTKFGILSYDVKDGRSLFGIERKPKDKISFIFNAEKKLFAVNIDFPAKSASDFGTLMQKLETTFGAAESQPNSLGVTALSWPEEDGTKISFTHIPGVIGFGSLLFSVEHRPMPEKVTKEDLGF